MHQIDVVYYETFHGTPNDFFKFWLFLIIQNFINDFFGNCLNFMGTLHPQ